MKQGHRFLMGALVEVALAVTLALMAARGQDSLAAGDTIYVDVDATGTDDGCPGRIFSSVPAIACSPGNHPKGLLPLND